jgi:hypothetical protein
MLLAGVVAAAIFLAIVFTRKGKEEVAASGEIGSGETMVGAEKEAE